MPLMRKTIPEIFARRQVQPNRKAAREDGLPAFRDSVFEKDPGAASHLMQPSHNAIFSAMDKQQQHAYLYAGGAVLFWSTVASAFKLTLRETGFVDMLFLSSIVSAAVLGIAVSVRPGLRSMLSWGRRDLASSALLGLLNPFLYYLVLFRAYDLLPAQEAQPLNYTWPIVLVLLSALFLGQRPGMRTLGAMLLSLGGVYVISTRGGIGSFEFSNPEGVALALGSSLIWASYWIFSVKSGRDETAKIFLNSLFGVVYVTLFYLVFWDPAPLTLPAVIGSAYVGCFEMGITFVFWVRALRLSSRTSRVSNLVYLSPFLSLLVIAAVVGETISLSTIAGLVLIVGGIVVERTGRTEAARK